MSMTIARAKTTHTNHYVNQLYSITMLLVIVFAIVSLFTLNKVCPDMPRHVCPLTLVYLDTFIY